MHKTLARFFGLLSLLPFAAISRADSFAYTTINVPGATSTLLIGISNNGVAVGTYYDSLGNTHGFEVLANGTLGYPFDDPSGSITFGSPPTTFANTALRGINDFGTIVGEEGPIALVGFILNGSAYTTYNVGGDDTQDLAINDQGDVAGTNVVAGQDSGFIVVGNANPVFVSVPGAFSTQILGINDLDYTWGLYLVSVGNHSDVYNFVRAPDGTITTISGPFNNGGLTFLGVNDNATLNAIPSFSVPGSNSTNISAMNDSGEFVGFYDDSTGNHAFIAEATPEPGSMMLSAIGFAGLVGLIFRKSRVGRPQSHLL